MSPTGPEGKVIEFKSRRRGFSLGWGLALAAALLAGSTAVLWNHAQRLHRELSAHREAVARLERRLAEERRWLDVLNAPGARVAELHPTPQGIAASRARATYDPSTRRAVLVFENLTAPSGHDYQLWALEGAGVASLGLITPDAGGRAVMRLENAGDPTILAGFAVSLEPAGGSPNPTAPSGPVVMAGRFGA